MSTDPVDAPPPWPAGHERVILASVDSTMAEAARRAPGLRAPTWILAHRQTAARGRRGRVWVEPPGNLAVTLVYPLRDTPARAALRSFVAGLALWEACARLTRRPDRLTLKWPNDLLLDGGKLAGILLETQAAGRGFDSLAVGFGVNLAAAPETEALEGGALAPAALAPATGGRVTPEAALAHLAPAWAGWEARFVAEGFAPLREAWLARAAGLGRPALVRAGSETIRGILETVDAEGRLVLSTPVGRRVVAAAEVFWEG